WRWSPDRAPGRPRVQRSSKRGRNLMRFTKIVLALAAAAVLVAIAATAGTARSAATHSNATTITFWHAYAENASAPEMQRLTKIVIPRFEQLNPEIKVQHV